MHKCILHMTDILLSAQRATRGYLSTNLKIFRGKLGISQEALADLAGLHRTYISQVEREIVNVSLDNLVLLAAALGVQVTDLLCEPREEAVPLKTGRKPAVRPSLSKAGRKKTVG